MGFGTASKKKSVEWSNKVPSKFKCFHRFIILLYFVSFVILAFKIIQYQFIENNNSNLAPDQIILFSMVVSGFIGGLLIQPLNFYLKTIALKDTVSNNFKELFFWQCVHFTIGSLFLIIFLNITAADFFT